MSNGKREDISLTKAMCEGCYDLVLSGLKQNWLRHNISGSGYIIDRMLLAAKYTGADIIFELKQNKTKIVDF